ncbi:MAG: hypothetical protein R3292_04895 [Alcanivorax sp.]|nr:hypothetical protein [Alcanivorax sp.]
MKGFTVAVIMVAGFLLAGPSWAGNNNGNDQQKIARGAMAWSQHCNRCHNLRSVEEKSPRKWDITVSHMRVIGNIPGSMADDIKAFLESTGKSAR